MKLFFDNWLLQFHAPWSHIAIIISAFICGIMIGTEREQKGKPAGLRTMILIAIGSALFTLISGLLGEHTDKSRVAAQIVSGIGFLGAGVILHDSVRIRGLTTAAMIWVMASIGMLCGAGYGGAAMAFTAALSLMLNAVSHIENRYIGPCFNTQITIIFDDANGKTGIKIDEILEEYKIKGNPNHKHIHADGSTELIINYCNAHKHHKAFLSKLADMPEIKSIKKAL